MGAFTMGGSETDPERGQLRDSFPQFLPTNGNANSQDPKA
jgi:hypothetical protein